MAVIRGDRENVPFLHVGVLMSPSMDGMTSTHTGEGDFLDSIYSSEFTPVYSIQMPVSSGDTLTDQLGIPWCSPVRRIRNHFPAVLNN